MKLTCNITLSEDEMKPLNTLHTLYITHFALTNDLYSYPKEHKDMAESGSALINAVQVLQELLNVTAQSSKYILQAVLWDLEDQINETYQKLLAQGQLKGNQLRFARAMLECLAGNTFYSATTFRYASVVPGSSLT